MQLLTSLFLVAVCTVFGASVASADTLQLAAHVTDAHGLVKKRDYIDWKKEQWAAPSSAAVGDALNEGMQIGTGDDSWAEVKWPHVTARAWANSSYAVAPNHKLVYLSNGEMLFQLDKHRSDKSEYCIWTNLLQARIRGTTVLVQSDAEKSRISVLEGTIDVYDRVEHSVVRLKPGVVYEVRAVAPENKPLNQSWLHPEHSKLEGTPESHEPLIREASFHLQDALGLEEARALGNEAENATHPVETLIAQGLREPIANTPETHGLVSMIDEKVAPLSLFETGKTIASLYLLDPKNVLKDVFSAGFKNELPSTALVRESMANFEPISTLGDIAFNKTVTNLLKTNVEPIRVPLESSYKIGQVFSTVLPLPAASLTHWAPSGWIAEAPVAEGMAKMLVAGNQPPQDHFAFHASRTVKALPILSLATFSANLPGGVSLPGAVSLGNGNLLTNNTVIVTPNAGLFPAALAPIVQGNLANNLAVAGLAGGTSQSGVNSSNTTIAGLTNSLLGANGLTNALLGRTGVVNSLVGTTTTTLNSTVGSVTTLVNGLGGTVTKTVGGLTGTLNNTLTNTLNTKTGLNLGGLLHH